MLNHILVELKASKPNTFLKQTFSETKKEPLGQLLFKLETQLPQIYDDPGYAAAAGCGCLFCENKSGNRTVFYTSTKFTSNIKELKPYSQGTLQQPKNDR